MSLISYLEFDNPQQNLLAGLGWDEKSDGGKGFFRSHHDLDLCCCLMTKDFNLIDFITPLSPKTNDYRMQILHTGDHKTGDSAGEDEELHFNLKTLNPDVYYAVFFVQAKGGTDFNKVEKPYCVFLDGSTYKKFLYTDIKAGHIEMPAPGDENVHFVSAALRRWEGESLDGDMWTLLPIERFIQKSSTEGADFFEIQEIVKEFYQG